GQWAQVLALQPWQQRFCRPDPEEGPSEVTDLLADALRYQWLYGYPGVPDGEEQLTHGFFKYVASMQALTARQLLRLNPSASSILDPFCGSGTVLIEAARAGRAATGSDASPLAAFVARHHTDVEGVSLDELRAQADVVAPANELELGWNDLRSRLGALPEGSVTSALWFCLLVALQRAGDGDAAYALSGSKSFVVSQSSEDPPQELAGPMFVGTVQLYAAQLAALRASMPFPECLVRTGLGDARLLKLSQPVDAVITSPPYPGVYNYANAALLTQSRLAGALGASLELSQFFGEAEDPARLTSNEIGSLAQREKLGRSIPADEFRETWQKQQEEWLQAVWRNLVPGGTATLVIGDGSDLDNLASTKAAAEAVGFLVVGSATIRMASGMPRRFASKGMRRTEHVLHL
ncbi:unnamed protein product, partial [Symbiodinium pilosum]